MIPSSIAETGEQCVKLIPGINCSMQQETLRKMAFEKGTFRSKCAAKPLRIPKSPTGSMSGRPIENIANISAGYPTPTRCHHWCREVTYDRGKPCLICNHSPAVQGPIPQTAVRLVTSSSSVIAATPRHERLMFHPHLKRQDSVTGLPSNDWNRALRLC